MTRPTKRSAPDAAPARDDAEAQFRELLRQIGARIRELRELQGLSLALLGEFTGLDVSGLSRIENGGANFKLKTADRLARGIGVHTHELFIPRELSEIEPCASESRHRARASTGTEDRVGAVETVEREFHELLEHIGSRIRELRQLQGLRGNVLADFADIVPHALSAIEAGKVNMTIRTVDRLARGIGVHTYELFIPRERSEIQLSPKSDAPPSRAKKSTSRAAKKKTGSARKRSSKQGARRDS